MACCELLLLLFGAANGVYIDLRNTNLTEIPVDVDPDVTQLHLEQNSIHVINATSLSAYTNLSELFLNGNKLRYIEDGAFDNNPSLLRLHLSGNVIETMSSSFGAAQYSIVAIDLWGSLTSIATPNVNFSGCVNMEWLNVGYNPFMTLDVSILPHNLTFLGLNYAQLAEFPDLTHQTPYILELHVGHNSIQSVPPGRIQGLKFLQKLFISGNNLHVLPDMLGTSITELKLAGNPLMCTSVFLCHLRTSCGVAVPDNPACETPEAYRDRPILAFNMSSLGCNECAGKQL